MQTITAPRSLSDVQDILYYVFPHLDPERSAGEDIIRVRQTLVRSAITCRNFTHPALDALWRYLPSDKPLISLLCTLGIAQDPLFLEGGIPTDDSHGLFASEDPRTHHNWRRFREYARRVRKITLRFSTDLPRVGIASSIWTEVSQFMQNEPILPLLQSIDIDCRNLPVSRTTPLLLISPSVREMNIILLGGADNPDQGRELDSFLSDTCGRAPNLETITLTVLPWDIDLAILHRNPRLRSITLQPLLKIENLEPLTHLTNLEHLAIYLDKTENTGAASPLSFPTLLSLSVRSAWDSMFDLFECVHGPNIRSLSLDAVQVDPRQLVPQSNQCLRTVTTRFPSLETFSLGLPKQPLPVQFGLSAGLVHTQSSLVSIIEPLVSLPGLRHIILDFPQFILHLTSNDIRMFAEAWPNIEELRIDLATADGHRAGFESVAHFARRCPRLRALHLPAMDLAVDAFEGVEYPAEPHPLRDLDVAEVVFPRESDLSLEMTVFIQRVFPNAAIPFATYPIVVTDEESGDRSRLV